MNEGEIKPCGMSESRLAMFIAQSLSDKEEGSVAEHLFECADCAAEVQQMREVRGLIREVALGASKQSASSMAAAIAAAGKEESESSIRSRLHAWSEKWSRVSRKLAGEVVRTVAEPAREAAAAVSGVGWMWTLSLQPATTRSSGQRRSATRQRAGRKPAGIPGADAPKLALEWSSESSVEVEISGLPSSAKAPLLMLVPLESRLPVRRAKLERKQGKWRATIEGVRPGSYTIALEPTEEE